MFTAKPPVFGPCKLLDFELEMVCHYITYTYRGDHKMLNKYLIIPYIAFLF